MCEASPVIHGLINTISSFQLFSPPHPRNHFNIATTTATTIGKTSNYNSSKRASTSSSSHSFRRVTTVGVASFASCSLIEFRISIRICSVIFCRTWPDRASMINRFSTSVARDSFTSLIRPSRSAASGVRICDRTESRAAASRCLCCVGVRERGDGTKEDADCLWMESVDLIHSAGQVCSPLFILLTTAVSLVLSLRPLLVAQLLQASLADLFGYAISKRRSVVNCHNFRKKRITPTRRARKGDERGSSIALRQRGSR